MARRLNFVLGLGSLVLGCSSSGASSTNTGGLETGLTETSSEAGSESTSDSGTESETTGPVTCDPECTDGVCIDGQCCDLASICNDACCGDGQVCSFEVCVTPGAICLDDGECAADEYCDFSLGDPPQPPACMGGAILDNGRCVPSPPECAAGEEPGPDGQVGCLPQCEFFPEDSFAPEVKYTWDDHNMMMAPIVMQLDDDNCDGNIDENDVPEIIFTTFASTVYQNTGTVRAISVVNGVLTQKWELFSPADPANPMRGLAAGDFHPNPGNEVVSCTDTAHLRAISGDGQELWYSDAVYRCDIPALADFDQDGQAEILTTSAILDGATGQTIQTFPNQTESTAADIDGDGVLEVVGTRYVLEADGTQLLENPVPAHHIAVADLDNDGSAEIIGVVKAGAASTHPHHLRIWRYDPSMPGGIEVIREGIDINANLSPDLCAAGSAGNTGGGGPPTVADFDGDGFPDVGVAGGVGYAVFSGAKLMDTAGFNDANTFAWINQTRDCSSANTGSSVFDFNGDGRAEVVYSDEHFLRIYRGTDGEVLFETCNTTGTLQEYPLVADVDADGHADIVAIANNYSASLVCPQGNTSQRGIRIFGDNLGKWVRTRRVWNQHNYHVTNIEEDGTVPTVEPTNWTTPGLNNFRQNVQPGSQFAAPDLVVQVLPQCTPTEYGALARVRNLGRAPVSAGIPVGFYDGDPAAGGTLLGTMMTTKDLGVAQSEDLVWPLDIMDTDLVSGAKAIWAVVDDGMPPHPWTECRLDNNSDSGIVPCAPVG